ncbi:MAG: PAS/PAC sensor signal transduction histidine kinase [Parcubacteria group bacterium GW2011_GWA2_47_7]|nr:MAG: PAS/PAC sensor signal transduction histidine kinase [Parcubacteria group bacterium GW2011_GWA2_47_7]
MKNYLRQFEVWATQSRHRLRYDWILFVRVKLFVFFLACSSAFSFVVYWSENPDTGKIFLMLIGATPLDIAVLIHASKIFSPTLTLGQNFSHLMIFLLLFVGSYLCTKMVMKTIVRGYNDQRRFASVVAHELRTPLSVMKTTAEISQMRGGELSKEEVKNFIENTIHEVDRMTEIIRFFLRFSLRDRSAHHSMAPLNVTDSINESIRIMAEPALENGVSVNFLDHGSSYIVWGNSVAFGDMLVNLLKNGIQYTPRGGKVTFEVKNISNGDVEIIIADDGPGIAPNDLPHIFEPFYRKALHSNNNVKLFGGGAGLGLSIVKDIVGMHHGKISVESVVGKGTSFHVVFSHA